MTRYNAITQKDAERLANSLAALPLPFTMTVHKGGKRSLEQNSLLHRWYADVSRHRGDMTAMQVKGQAHVAYGVPIRMRDEVWSRVWAALFAPLDYEQQCFLFERGVLSMTRDMTVKELTEYMDAASADWRAEGIRLTDPEILKWEGAA